MGEGFAVLCCWHYTGDTLVRGRLHTAGRLLTAEGGWDSNLRVPVLDPNLDFLFSPPPQMPAPTGNRCEESRRTASERKGSRQTQFPSTSSGLSPSPRPLRALRRPNSQMLWRDWEEAMSGLAALSRYRGKRDFPYNTKQGCFGNEKNGKQDHAPVGQERRGAGVHWDCGKGNIPTARFHNTAPGPWRLRDCNQPLLPNRCLSLDPPVLLGSFEIILPPFPRT